MPALAGEPWRGNAVSRVNVTASPNSNRLRAWVSFESNANPSENDENDWEGTPGSSLTLRFRWDEVGVHGQQAPNFATVEARLPGGAIVGSAWSVAFPAENTEVTRTFHFDDNPLNQVLGAVRAGMVELYLNWGSTGGVAPWNADSRGGSAGVLGTNTHSWGAGYVRAPGTLSAHSISNVAIGGAEPALFASPDPIHTRITTTQWFEAAALELELRASNNSTIEREQTGGAVVGPNFDFSWTGTTGTNRRVGNSMELSAALKDLLTKLPTTTFGGDAKWIWAASGHEASWTFSTSQTLIRADRITADPRITVDHHLQLNNNSFATPPSSRDATPKHRLTSDLAFTGFRITNARGEGLNSISVTEKLWDVDNLAFSEASPKINRTVTTSTQGGEAGWFPNFTNNTWDSALPGGAWPHKIIIATTDLTGLEVNQTENFTLLANNPAIVLVVSGGPINQANHVVAGKEFRAGVVLVNTSTGLTIEASEPRAAICRLQDTGVNAGFAEFLDAANVWQPMDQLTDALFFHTLTETRADSNVYTKTWSAADTAGWGEYDIFVVGQAKDSTGTPYSAAAREVVVGSKNSHKSYSFDPTGLFQ